MYTYTDYFSILDWELQQESDGGDTASADKFRKLPSTESKRYINDTRRELIGKNYERFEKEIIFRFFDETSTLPSYEDGYYNIEITSDHISGNTFIVPNDIAKFIAYKNSSSLWLIPPDSSQFGVSIYSPSHNKIYNSDGWTAGTELTAKVIQFPEDIKETITLGAALLNEATAYPGSKVLALAPVTSNYQVGDLATISSSTVPAYDGSWRVLAKATSNQLVLDLDYTSSGSGDITRNYEPFEIEWPEEYIRLLTLEIKKKIYARKNKALSQYEWIEYNDILTQWKNDTGRVKQFSSIAFKGYGLGKW